MSKNSSDQLNNIKILDVNDPLKSDYNVFSDLPHFLLNWIEENANDIVGVWNSKGELQFISANVKNIYGYDSNELLDSKWKKLITAEEYDFFLEMLDFNTKYQSLNVNIQDYNGNLILSKLLIQRVLDKKSNDVYYISIIQDISDQLSMQNMITDQENTSLTGQVTASIAHEIRNPLTSLKGFLQLLESGVSEKEIYYKIMIEEIEKIEMITSDLLLISKPLIKKKKLESVYSMIHDVVVLLNTQAQIRNIKVVLPEKIDLQVYCDRAQIKQVLINIIKNAIEASNPSDKITLKLCQEETNIYIEIIDEGAGISDEILQKIDEPFFTTKETGTGLGLMITNQILKQHKGSLNIKKNKKRGSTFIVILPTL